MTVQSKFAHGAPGGYFFIWPTRGRSAGQGMVFGLSVLNRVYSPH